MSQSSGSASACSRLAATDALAREKINVTAVRPQSKDDLAFMRFTFDVANVAQLKRAHAEFLSPELRQRLVHVAAAQRPCVKRSTRQSSRC